MRQIPVLFLVAVLLSVTGARADLFNLFPVPVSDESSAFPEVDDSFLEVPFTGGFTFPFYGTSYSSVFLNTNGGLTFNAGEEDYDLAAEDVVQPGIAVFWGDLDAEEYEGLNRPGQMGYEQLGDRFVVDYNQFQDNDDGDWNNSATLSLFPDGTILIEYGLVLSEDILVGVWDGTHIDDRYLGVQSFYERFDTTGSGIILFDDWGEGPTYGGELDNRTIVFSPIPEPATAAAWLGLAGLGLLMLRQRRR